MYTTNIALDDRPHHAGNQTREWAFFPVFLHLTTKEHLCMFAAALVIEGIGGKSMQW